MSGRPGPVVLALPEDVLSAPCAADVLPKAEAVGQGASIADIHRIISDLQGSSKPFLIVGGGGWDAEARVALGNFAEAMQVPVGTSFRCQDYIDNRHPNYAGDVGIAISPTLAARVRARQPPSRLLEPSPRRRHCRACQDSAAGNTRALSHSPSTRFPAR